MAQYGQSTQGSSQCRLSFQAEGHIKADSLILSRVPRRQLSTLPLTSINGSCFLWLACYTAITMLSVTVSIKWLFFRHRLEPPFGHTTLLRRRVAAVSTPWPHKCHQQNPLTNNFILVMLIPIPTHIKRSFPRELRTKLNVLFRP